MPVKIQTITLEIMRGIKILA